MLLLDTKEASSRDVINECFHFVLPTSPWFRGGRQQHNRKFRLIFMGGGQQPPDDIE